MQSYCVSSDYLSTEAYTSEMFLVNIVTLKRDQWEGGTHRITNYGSVVDKQSDSVGTAEVSLQVMQP